MSRSEYATNTSDARRRTRENTLGFACTNQELSRLLLLNFSVNPSHEFALGSIAARQIDHHISVSRDNLENPGAIQSQATEANSLSLPAWCAYWMEFCGARSAPKMPLSSIKTICSETLVSLSSHQTSTLTRRIGMCHLSRGAVGRETEIVVLDGGANIGQSIWRVD